jgi:hypothetical protein
MTATMSAISVGRLTAGHIPKGGALWLYGPAGDPVQPFDPPQRGMTQVPVTPSCSSSAPASRKDCVSKPSANQPWIGARRS